MSTSNVKLKVCSSLTTNETDHCFKWEQLSGELQSSGYPKIMYPNQNNSYKKLKEAKMTFLFFILLLLFLISKSSFSLSQHSCGKVWLLSWTTTTSQCHVYVRLSHQKTQFPSWKYQNILAKKLAAFLCIQVLRQSWAGACILPFFKIVLLIISAALVLLFCTY